MRSSSELTAPKRPIGCLSKCRALRPPPSLRAPARVRSGAVRCGPESCLFARVCCRVEHDCTAGDKSRAAIRSHRSPRKRRRDWRPPRLTHCSSWRTRLKSSTAQRRAQGHSARARDDASEKRPFRSRPRHFDTSQPPARRSTQQYVHAEISVKYSRMCSNPAQLTAGRGAIAKVRAAIWTRDHPGASS